MADEILDEFEKVEDDAEAESAEEAVIEEEVSEEVSEPEPSEEEIAKQAEAEGLDKSAYTDCMKEQLKAGKSFAEAAKYCKAKVKKAKPKKEEEGCEEEEEEKKAESPVDILKKALKSDDLTEVKDLIKKAIKALSSYGYGYGYPKPKEGKKPKKEEYGYGYGYPEPSKKIEDFLASVDSKLEEIKSLVKASVEEASVKETPEGEAKAEKVEAQGEEAKVEANEETVEKVEKAEETEKTESSEAKTDTSSRGASDLMTILQEIKSRLEKLEASPAPSKVVFSKEFVGNTESSDELKKIESRLAELTEKREKGELTDKERDEAYDLIKRKKALLGLY